MEKEYQSFLTPLLSSPFEDDEGDFKLEVSTIQIKGSGIVSKGKETCETWTQLALFILTLVFRSIFFDTSHSISYLLYSGFLFPRKSVIPENHG